MKTILQLLVLVICLQLHAQQAQLNNQITDPRGNQVLWGPLNQEGLSSGSFANWFNPEYQNYKPNPELIKQLKAELNQYTITIFMGTWCGDSKREVPRFLSVLNAANFNAEQLQIIGLRSDAPYYKLGPNNEESGLGIHRVPTFIIYKNGVEVNRIVESPKENLEQDLAAIIKGEYQANYPVVQETASILNTIGLTGFKPSAVKKLAKQWKPKVTSLYELNTYARVLLGAGKSQEAVAVLKLNIGLFPEDHRAYGSLATKLEQLDQPKDALKYYLKASKLAPENTDYTAAIERLKDLR